MSERVRFYDLKLYFFFASKQKNKWVLLSKYGYRSSESIVR